MITHFFILSDRGDSIIARAFRGQMIPDIADDYFQKVKTSKALVPVYKKYDLTVLTMQKFGLHFIITTPTNISPNFALNALSQTITLFKDFCGILDEESLRLNFVLIYELLDEIWVLFIFPHFYRTLDTFKTLMPLI